jgi:hypothetical protein
MKLNVQFHVRINIHAMSKNYSGMIRLNPLGFPPQTFYFYLTDPYDGAQSELSIFLDEARMRPYAEALGVGNAGINPHTGKPVVAFDFSGLEDDLEKISVTFVITQIISEAIYRTELEWQDKSVKMKANEVLTQEFTHVWEQDFAGPTERYARGFIQAFGQG